MKKKLVAFVFGVVLCVSCSMLAFATQDGEEGDGGIMTLDVSQTNPSVTPPDAGDGTNGDDEDSNGGTEDGNGGSGTEDGTGGSGSTDNGGSGTEDGSGSTGNTGSSNTSGGSSIGTSGSCGSSASAPDYFDDFIEGVEQKITKAQNDSTVKIVKEDSITLTGNVMRELINNPTISLYLEYTYNGKEYKVLIPAGEAFVVEGIELYGPLYLYSMFPYDEQEALTKGKEYIIVKGDTLSKIANKNKTTVSELVKLNKIKNPNRIRAGQRIVLPAK